MSKASVTKKLMIETQAGNGKCYLRLLTMTPAYKKCSAISVEAAIVYMINILGQNPEGSKILPELFICNEILKGDHDFPNRSSFDSLNAINSIQFMDYMFNSTFRYTWEEIGGIQHIGGFIDSNENSKEVWNILGFSSRYVLCMLINPGVRVGSEVNYGGLFDQIVSAAEEEDDELSYRINQMGHQMSNDDSGYRSIDSETQMKSPRVSSESQKSDNERLAAQVRRLQREIAKTSNHQRSPDLDEYTIKRFSDLFDKQTKVRTELAPEDSSSVLNRYQNKYLEEGTIFDVRGDGKTRLTTQTAVTSLRPEKQVVVGYQKTPEMVIRENKQYLKVNAINGLANPFHSHRLNFLCHFDTAVSSIQIRKEDYTHYDILVWISKHKSQSPSQELLFQVVSNTFDLEANEIVANPYKLPFIEVGMLISDDCLAKCFDLLGLEYKTLWFEKMKGLVVPKFHSEFSSFKDGKVTSKKDKEKSVKFQQSEPKPSSNSKHDVRKRGGSVFSILK